MIYKAANHQREFRELVGREIDRLIALLDYIEGDPDLEETGDEHDVGMNEGWRQHRPSQFLGNPLEDDEDDDPGEDDGTAEPELGWCGIGTGCAAKEPRHDREGDDEREEDPAEWGIADQDALSDMGFYI